MGPAETTRNMLATQRAQLDALTAEQSRKLLALLKATRQDLRDRISEAGSGAFASARVRLVSAQVELAIADLERRMRSQLGELGASAYTLAAKHLAAQLATFGDLAGTPTPPLSIGRVVALQDEVLLQRYAVSVRTYGADLIQRAQASLAQSALEQVAWGEMEKRLAGVNGVFAQDYGGGVAAKTGKQSRGERIVRTETMNAYSRAHLLGSQEMDAQDPGYLKQLVATFDARTGADSVFVHGQIRELDKPFRDNAGRLYMHPPNRPNDREVVVLVRPEWVSAGIIPAESSDAESEQALRRARNRALAFRGGDLDDGGPVVGIAP